MAPLPPNSTARYVVHYTSGSREHTQLWRSGTPASPSAMGDFLNQVWTDVSPIIFAATILDLVFYADGADVGNSVATTDFVGNTYGTGDPSNNTAALFLDFIGRSSGGKRVRVSFYSPTGTDPSWRFNAGESTAVDNVVMDLQSNSVDLVAIDGLVPIWKAYANVGYNAYWQRARRS